MNTSENIQRYITMIMSGRWRFTGQSMDPNGTMLDSRLRIRPLILTHADQLPERPQP